MPLPVVGSTWNMPASIRVHTFHGAYCTATSRVVPDASQSATGWLRYRGAPEGWIFTRRRELRKKNRSLQLKSRSRCGLVSQWLCASSPLFSTNASRLMSCVFTSDFVWSVLLPFVCRSEFF